MGWDGVFKGISIPSPNVSAGDGTSSMGNFSSHNFEGFNGPGEASGPVGPMSGASSGQPTNGNFPGEGTGFDGFGRQNER